MTSSTTFFALVLVSLTVSSCAGHEIKINDITLYGDKGKFGATAVHSLRKDIPPLPIDNGTPPKPARGPWDVMRVGMVCADGNAIATLLENIDKLCTLLKTVCTYEAVRAVKLNVAGAFFNATGGHLRGFSYQPLDETGAQVAISLGADVEAVEYGQFNSETAPPPAF